MILTFPNAQKNPAAITAAFTEMTAAQIAEIQGILAITAASVADPAIDPTAGEITTDTDITITTTTSGATIRYTTDGEDPTPSVGTVYSAAFFLSAPATVKAIAYKDGWVTSSIVDEAFTIATVANPTVDPNGGAITDSTPITLATATSGASIRYTTNGANPTTTSGTLYTVPFTLPASATVKAIAYRTGYISSAVVSKIFTVS